MKNSSLIIKNTCLSFCLLATHAVYSLPPTPPSMEKISISSLDVSVSWTSVADATGYELFYAPYPKAEYINSIDMGSETRFSATLWEEASFYVAIQAYNRDGNSEYSNIEHFGGSCLNIPQGQISLPKDEMFHSEPIEWWYWTGHLQTEKGRWFGFEHTVFLIRMFGQTVQMVHHAITDIDDGTFHYAVTTQRAAPIAQTSGFNWEVNGLVAQGSGGIDSIHGETDDYVLDIKLKSTKPVVFQHEEGYTNYSFGGNTYYYSYQRMAAEGTLKVGNEELPVRGTGWFDHQWGDLTQAINSGWDWFAIQLDDNREIMLANVNVSAEEDVMVGNSYADDDCQVSELNTDEIEITPLGEWTSPHTQCTYPQKWNIRVGDLNLTVTPVIADQELSTDNAFLPAKLRAYWEGVAIVSGDATGRAYVELAGYCE